MSVVDHPEAHDDVVLLSTELLEAEIHTLIGERAAMKYRLLDLVAEYDQRGAWVVWGVVSCAHWLAERCGIEISTAREQVRVAKAIRSLPLIRLAFAEQALSYSKVRILTRVATPDNEAELVEIGEQVPAGELNRHLANRRTLTEDPNVLAEEQREARSLSWRTEADGTVVLTLRLPPEKAAGITVKIDAEVMAAPPDAPAGASERPTLAQMRADAMVTICSAGGGSAAPTEVVVHAYETDDGRIVGVLPDGTAVPGPVVSEMSCSAVIRALMHDSEGKPIDVSPGRRGPTKRQMMLLLERDKHCTYKGCRSKVFLHAHHVIHRFDGGPTTVANLKLMCGFHHRLEHRQDG